MFYVRLSSHSLVSLIFSIPFYYAHVKLFCRCFLYGVWARESMVIFMKGKENVNVKNVVGINTERDNNIPPQYVQPRIPTMMTIRQAAATGILPEAALRRMVKNKTIPAIYSGTKAFINFDRLCEMLSQTGAVS